MVGLLWLFIVMLVISLLFNFLFRFLPYLILIVLILYVVQRVMNWVRKDDSIKPTPPNNGQGSQSKSPDVIDVEYRERDVDE